MNSITINPTLFEIAKDKDIQELFKEFRNPNAKEKEVKRIMKEYEDKGYFYNLDNLISNENFKSCREQVHKIERKFYINCGLTIYWCNKDKIYWSRQSSFGPVIEVEK